jgi:Phage gp6-like head-tail connector protein
MMELAELKKLLGIAEGDTSQDAILSLYLEAGLDAAKAYTNLLDWETITELPAPVRLGIAKWVEANPLRSARNGVQSESMAGMTQTFTNGGSDNVTFAESYSLWGAYRKKGVVFRAATKKSLGYTGTLLEVPDEYNGVTRLMTGNPTKL